LQVSDQSSNSDAHQSESASTKQRLEKKKKELYANLLANSLFLDEEEEANLKKQPKNLSEAGVKSHKAVQNFRNRQKQDSENVNSLNNPCHPAKPLLKYRKSN